MPFRIIRNDITKVRADAIVNTANPEPIFAGGTDSAIYHAAGARRLLAERKKIGYIEPGEAAVTKAFRLPAKFIIHTVGPAWMGGNNGEFELLASCYRKSLLLAHHLGCRSIAFPLISTGVYGFPKDKALEIALAEFSAFLRDEETDDEDAGMDITLVVFDRKAFEISSDLVADVSQYIDENYVEIRHAEEYRYEENRQYIEKKQYREKDQHTEDVSYTEEYNRSADTAGSYRKDIDADDADQGGIQNLIDVRRRRAQAGRTNRRLSEIFRFGAAGSAPAGPLPSPDAARASQSARRDEAPVQDAEEAVYEQAPHYPEAGRETAQGAPAPAEIMAEPSKAAGMRKPDARVAEPSKSAAPARSLQDVMSRVGESFQERLLRLIDERGLKDAQVYKRANIDRKLFSKIRCNPDYTPKRQTAIALALALELNLDEMTDLLRRAGIALSPGSKSDLIIRYCVENGIYDPMKVDALLFDYGQKTLAGY